MTQQDYLIKRESWLKETSQICNTLAKQINLDYTVFQTQGIKYNPDLLVIGINPGGDKKYLKALEENGWSERPWNSLFYDTNTMTHKPDWETGKGADYLRSRVRQVFTQNNGMWEILDNAEMINLCYFNTKNETILKGTISTQIQKKCIEQNKKLIELMHPKNILILSSSPKYFSALGMSDYKQVSAYIKQATINDTNYLSIPHYAAHTNIYSKENGNGFGLELMKFMSF